MDKIILALTTFLSSFWIKPPVNFVFYPPVLTPVPTPEVSIIVTGDVIPARLVNFKTSKDGDFTYFWASTADFLKTGDLAVVNLEAPIFKDCPLINSGFQFCGSDKHVAGLLYAGIDVVTLGNNHIGNFGMEKADETVALLNSQGIKTSLPTKSLISEKNGTKFAFLAYNFIGETPLYYENEIALATKSADVVIAVPHWGAEYQAQPDNQQKLIAHKMIDAGADLIIGNHPHWIQPYEIYKDKFIMYAHGNFIFDQSWSEKTMLGVVGRYTFSGKKLTKTEFFPIKISGNFQPQFLQGPERQKILDDLKTESDKLKSSYEGQN